MQYTYSTSESSGLSSLLRKHSAEQVDTRAEALCEIYEYVVDERGIHPDSLTVGHIIDLLSEEGILFWRDSRFVASQDVGLSLIGKKRSGAIVPLMDQEAAAKVPLDFEQCVSFISPVAHIFRKAFSEEFVVPDWPSLVADMTYHFYKVQDNKDGATAQYIPILRDANPEYWALSVCSVDGQRFSIGDYDTTFSIQSVSKPVTYGLCLKAEGEEEVDRWIGVEPAGRPFNTQDLDSDTQTPFNASINSGAIMAAGLFASRFPDSTWEQCVDKIRETWRQLSGEGFEVGFSRETFESEKETAYNNFAIAYNLKGRRGLPRDVDIHKMLDVYLGCCSIEMSSEALSVAAATLANGGVCPITGKEVFPSNVVRHVLAETMTCGMYDQSGRFAIEVGLVAKSGVAGALMVIVPNVFGFSTFSPRLNKQGNSVRGLEFCKSVVKSYGVHIFEPLRSGNAGAKVDPRVNGSKDERVGSSRFVWAYQAGDGWAITLHDIFLHTMVQAACASSEGLSGRMRNVVRSNYELVYHVPLRESFLEEVIKDVADPGDMKVLKQLKGDRTIPDAFRPVILAALMSVLLADGQINENEQAFAIEILSLTGMDRCVATMEVDRYIRQLGHGFREVPTCEIDTKTLVELLPNDLVEVQKSEEDAANVVTSEKEQPRDEVILLRREVHRLQRKVDNLTRLLHESRQDRTARRKSMVSIRNIARLSINSEESDA